MRLRHLAIHRFRGIRHLDWTPRGHLIALVGAGDSTKTTILDAIGFLASPRIGITFTDTDFFEGDASSGFRLEGTISDLPHALLADDRLGLVLRGVDEHGTIHDEPGDFAPAITIRLDVNESLEPMWYVVTDRNPDGRPLSARDRALLGVSRVGDKPDRQFTWARGSALARLTASTEQLRNVITAAYRQARDAVAGADLGELDEAVERAQSAGAQLGAGPVTEDMDIRLDASPNGSGALSLHHNGIPLGSGGLGTRRLLALGLELASTPDGAILAIDEIEHGLEPHRLRHLLRALRRKVADDGIGHGQVLFTTHSPVVLEELGPHEIAVVHASSGLTEVRSIPHDLAALVRSTPEAFLSRRMLVCEGKTEIGVIRGHDEAWSARHDSRSLAHLGVVAAFGGGSETGKRAQAFMDLGYSVAVLADSDASFDPDHDALSALGAVVVRWDGDCAIEERAATDLSWDSLCVLFDKLVEDGFEPAQLVNMMHASTAGAAACARAGLSRPVLGNGLNAMVRAGLTETEVRGCFGETAKKKSWFKRVNLGEMLGCVIAADDTIPYTDLGQKLAQIERWCYAE